MNAAMLMDEMALVARAKAELDAFADIYDHYFPRVYNYVRYRVHDAQTADDLTALVFERAWSNLKRYQPKSASFGAWLFGIARNAISDHYRRGRETLPLDDMVDQPGDEPMPEDEAARSESNSRLLAAVARLNERERELIALKFGAGLTNVEIAHMHGLRENNVAVILHRAMQHLKVWIEE
jgi:RNA polymerase sigma-70 factor, ECF subfamily